MQVKVRYQTYVDNSQHPWNREQIVERNQPKGGNHNISDNVMQIAKSMKA